MKTNYKVIQSRHPVPRSFARVSNVMVLYLLSLMLFSVPIQSLAEEKAHQLIQGDTWELRIMRTFLTQEFGDYTLGIHYALPGQSLIVIFFEIRYTGDDKKASPPLEEAKIKEATTGSDVMSKEMGMRMDFSMKRDGSNILSGTSGSPAIRWSRKEGEIATFIYIASIPENKKDLIFELPGTRPVELQALLQSKGRE